MNPRLHILAIGTAVFALLAAPATTQETVATRARKAFDSEDWATASTLYGELFAQNDEDLNSRLRLAACCVQLGRGEDALALVPERRSPERVFSAEWSFWRAAALCLSEETEAAQDELEHAVRCGWGNRQLTAVLPALAPLENTPRYEALLLQLARTQGIIDPGLDPLLGDWHVTVERPDAAGTLRPVVAGTRRLRFENHRTTVVDELDCGGTSFFVWTPARGVWQLYRSDPARDPGRLRLFSGQCAEGEGEWYGGAVWPGNDAPEQLLRLRIRRTDDGWIEDLLAGTDGEPRLIERRRHRRP